MSNPTPESLAAAERAYRVLNPLSGEHLSTLQCELIASMAAEIDTSFAGLRERCPAMEWFIGTPPDVGFYYFAEKRRDWDMGRPVPVSRRSWYEGGKPVVVFEANVDGQWVNVEELKDGIWYGPLPKAPEPPEWLLSAALSPTPQSEGAEK